MATEQAFLESLFADLDALANFDAPPSSDSPRAPMKQPRRPSPRAPTQAAATVATHSTPLRASPQAKLPSPPGSPFWADPGKRPIVRPVDLSRHRHVASVRSAPAGPSGVKRTSPGGSVPVSRPVKRVEVKVEELCSIEMKENSPPARPRQQEPPAAVTFPAKEVKPSVAEQDMFDDFLDDVDWNDAIMNLDASEAASVVKGVPRGKRYTRAQVMQLDDGLSEAGYLQKTLLVQVTGVEGYRQVVLHDDWVETPIEVDDFVNLIGDFDADSTPAMHVTRNNGYLILHPDILVSSTKVADSAHCARKALLQELIRTSAGTGSASPALVYGNMIHELMQAAMTEDKWDDDWRREKIVDIVAEQIGQLWTMDLSVDRAVENMMDKTKELEAFSATFVGREPKPEAVLSDLRATKSDEARLAITSTLSVEEDIWSPRYGLKGKIDVSVNSKVREGSSGNVAVREGALPFEIKTGRTNAASEHRAQTMLYTLLMSDRYDEEIDSGLLFYSQSNQLLRVTAARNELRGLLIARNEFATYLHRRMTLSTHAPNSTAISMPNQTQRPGNPASIGSLKVDEGEEALWSSLSDDADVFAEEQIERSLLPPPIDEERSCKHCYVGDACMLFRKAVEGDVEISSDETNPLQVAYELKTGHLTSEHLDFFKKWEKLISYEEQELVRFKKEIWTMTAEERAKFGRCLANMSIDTSYIPAKPATGARISRYTYCLHHATPLPTQATGTQQAARSLLSGGITVNDPVVVSLENPSVLSISRGFVLEITSTTIVLGLDHSLTNTPQAARILPASTQHSDLVFRIDKDELAAGMGRIRDNLIQLFVVGGDEKRRQLIVDLDKPTFSKGLGSLDSSTRRKLIPSHLNADQERAVEKVLTAQDYALILGMPGTGKTTTIAEILKALAKAGKSVLLTSYTHSAVDNILLKVKDAGISILRLGNRDKVMPALHQFTIGPDNKATTLSELDNQYMQPQIVAMTCLGINEPIFAKRRFDVCVVDEASQVTLPTCLGPLRFADTFVLVGDHNQLPPLVRNQAARKGGLDVSLFKRLSDAHPASLVYLTQQYRMNEDIMLLSNKLVYQDRLQVGSPLVAHQRLALTRPEAVDNLNLPEQQWLRDLLDPERTVVFADTDRMPARERRIGSLIQNEGEAQLVLQMVDSLLRCGVPAESVGVIALYRQQLKLISRKLEHVPKVEVLTADQSQGRDKDCIIMSLTRSNQEGNVGDLLKDWRRINVCLTRAKSKLIVFGSRSTLTRLPLLERFFKVVAEQDWIYNLPSGAVEVGVAQRSTPSPDRIKRERETTAPAVPSLAVHHDGRANKVMRKGAGALALSSPLSQDIVNCM